MAFDDELKFESALIEALSHKGWEANVIKNPTEEDLIQNWADILFENNSGIDRLNGCPLTRSEMEQILNQIQNLRTPLKLNGFINGGSVSIKRDNPEDKLHFQKEISMKIYNRKEIAAGQSRYQIVEQPHFNVSNKMLSARRGDLMLLINGMPVIHIELKKSGISVSQACNQIDKYRIEGVFSGIFSLVQVFVAMNPEETLYFANPGPEGTLNKNFFFHWADFNNEPINEWKAIAEKLLSIPMAHQLIGFYAVADDTDGILKVMRSYQYYAASKISDKVSKTDWEQNNQLGGYIWHTTGSGKTMTSFKSAELIASSKDADKVIFLMDRIELGTQSLMEYQGFASATEEVQATEDTVTLIGKLKSTDPKNTLIVTSIQKMSNIKDDASNLNTADLDKMQSKRIVFIVDEAHRSTFGDMMITIKQTFPKALFFGFTGTPIQEENQKKMNTTMTVFGPELHRYTIADGIRDKNVLGFDKRMVMTYKDTDLRVAVGLDKAKASSVEEVLADEKKKEIFNKYQDASQVPMAGYVDNTGNYVKGIEDELSKSQYTRDEHTFQVVKDIKSGWDVLSQGGKFHAIFATSSIPEAVNYYRLIRKEFPELKVTGLFDPSIDNNGTKALEKEDGIVEMLTDYKMFFGADFTIPTYASFKKDVSARLAHKKPYERISTDKSKQLDLLIVVNQMLTGFDSKWINTLYLDKILKYEEIIQAFSRTNRLFPGNDKPYGIIKFYRKPHTMERNIAEAVKLYSGEKAYGLFVQKLDRNLLKMNYIYTEIKQLFADAGIDDFHKLPDNKADRGKFASLFKELSDYYEAARIQGFTWTQKEYLFEKNDMKDFDVLDPNTYSADNTGKIKISMLFDEQIYLILAKRYKELFSGGGSGTSEDVPYEIDGNLIEIDTGRIDTDYMNSKFVKFLKALDQGNATEEDKQKILEELHKSFAVLSQEEQKYANIFLHDIASGDISIDPSTSFRDYITKYMMQGKNSEISKVADALGIDFAKLKSMVESNLNEKTINEYGRFDELKAAVDRTKARAYFETVTGQKLSPPKVNIKIDKLLRSFIISGGFDIDGNSDSGTEEDIVTDKRIDMYDVIQSNIVLKIAEDKFEYDKKED